MPDYSQFVKSAYINLEPRELLQENVSALLGVSEDAARELKGLQVYKVFDLATSKIFDNARKIVETAKSNNTVFGRYGRVPADIVDNDQQSLDITELQLEPIQVLEGIGPINGPRLVEALQVQTIRDLAYWPPYTAAVKIMLSVLLPEETEGYDPEAPPDLLPKSGEYPTEKVFYEVVVLDEIEGEATKPLAGNPVDVADLSSTAYGFDQPAFGAIITYEQAWYAQGVALGNLLHSVALAPGESTRIAMVDWSRRTSARTDEEISQIEQLSNITGHNRAISEVTGAVAAEAQEGFSTVRSDSKASSEGEASGGGVVAGAGGGGGAGAGGGGGGAAAGYLKGKSKSSAYNWSSVSSVSSSSGRRELAAEMSQRIADSTQQNANSARNRRASIITEVSQHESETLSTRVVTNYNHMHALSIQYYEVVQIYRMTTQVSKVDKCIFVPMKVVSSWSKDIVSRFRDILLTTALDERVQLALVEDENTVKIVPASSAHAVSSISNTDLNAFEKGLENNRQVCGEEIAPDIFGPWKLGENFWQMHSVWESQCGSAIDAASIGTLKRIVITCNSGQPPHVVDFESTGDSDRFIDDSLRNFQSLYLDYEAINPGVEAVMIQLNVKVKHFVGEAYCDLHLISAISDLNVTDLEDGTKRVKVADFLYVPSSDWLLEHLEQNRLYYSQAIWLNMDPATRTLLLSPYKYKDKPLLQQIDSTPVTLTGNYLVFRTHVDRQNKAEWKEWEEWLEHHGFKDKNVAKHEIVPLPSGGVFAEAVLGRFNAAEKLDLTRFWNWQDSPIPFAAPEIAPLTAGGKTQDIQVTPGQLEQPLINIVNPTPLPDPQGMSAIINALTASNMFRDMSGRDQAFGLAQAGLEAASTAATAAGQQAGENMAVAAETVLEAYKAVLGFAGSALADKPSLGKTNPSTFGGLLNKAKELDKVRDQVDVGGKARPTATPISGGSPADPAGKGGIRSRNGQPSFVEELVKSTISPGSRFATLPDGTGETGDDEGAGEESNELGPRPQRYGHVGEALRKPSLGLLTVYLSQYEGDERIPDRANQLFRFNVMQSMGQQLRHDHLQYYFQTLQPVSLGWLYDRSLLLTEGEPGLASLLCHNHTRSLGVRACYEKEGSLEEECLPEYEDMALPWEKVRPWGNGWVKYKARYFDPMGSFSEQTYLFRRDVANTSVFERGGKPSAFYLLHRPDEILGTEHPNDWYHFFVTQTITAFHSTECIADEAAPDWSDDSWTVESVALYYVLKWLVGLLREASPGAMPDDHHYAGWLWANAMSFMEGLFYEEPQNQADSTRESKIHRLGAYSGIDRAMGVVNIMGPGKMPNWRWYVPKAMGLWSDVQEVVKELRSVMESGEVVGAIVALEGLGSKLGELTDTIGPYVYQTLDMEGNLLYKGIGCSENGSIETLAAQILNHSRITLATAHALGEDDNATARQNILDTMNRLEAARSNYGNAPGGTVQLDSRMLEALLRLADTYSYAISELAGGSHSPDSRHYAGVAADINVINDEDVGPDHSDVTNFMQMCRDLGATEVLGPGDEDHDDHVHAAWPKP